MKIDSNVLKHLALINQIGISMIVPIFICLYIGKWIDSLLSTNAIITLLMLFIGIMVSFRNFFVMTSKFINKDKGENHERRK